MKKYLLFLITSLTLLCLPVQAGTLDVGITSVSSSGSIPRGARTVMMIFSSTFAGTVQGVAFTGAEDASIYLTCQPGDHLDTITYTRSAGSIRIIILR